MIRRPPRSTLDRSSAASDVYKRQLADRGVDEPGGEVGAFIDQDVLLLRRPEAMIVDPVSYTHLRAHETVLDLVCRLLLEKKKKRRVEDGHYIIACFNRLGV